MSKNQIYKITINNFDKYNGKKKRGYESILLSCRFFDDAKIMRLTPHQRLIYIRLLLIAGDFTSSSIEVHPEMLSRSTGVPRQIIVSSLNSLVENQLVTIEKNEFPLEKKRKEEKRKIKKSITHEKNIENISVNIDSLSNLLDDENDENDYEKKLRKEIRVSYSEAYKERYNVDVILNRDFNSKIKALSLRLGKEAIDVVKFYLTHNDSFYLKATHSIGLCLRDCESLRTQMLRGRAITGADARRGEKTQTMLETIAAVEKGGL